MKLIAHRGNITGPNQEYENYPYYVEAAINAGYNVEIDVWFNDGKWWLGHDFAKHYVNIDWLKNLGDAGWLHCKNFEALIELKYKRVTYPRYFWHDTDDFTLTNDGLIWTYPRHKLSPWSICVAPSKGSYADDTLKACFGICDDNIEKYNYLL